MAHAVRRRTLSKQRQGSTVGTQVSPVFRSKRIQSCRNIVGQDTKYRSSNLHTEVVLRKEKLTPERLHEIRKASENLSENDKAFLIQVFNDGDIDQTGLLVRSELHAALNSMGITVENQELDDLLAFADADSSKAIDLDEWLMLIGLLIQPPYDEDELETSFALLFRKTEDGKVKTGEFYSVLEEVLKLSLGPAELEQLPTFMREVIHELDPQATGLIDPDDAIETLLTPYHDS